MKLFFFLLKMTSIEMKSFFMISLIYSMAMLLEFIFSFQVSKAIVDKCLEIGVNFFDTAEVSKHYRSGFDYNLVH